VSTSEMTDSGYKIISIEGLGRIFKPRWKRKDGTYYESPHWWIGFYHRGEDIRKSSKSESEAEARKLLKRNVMAIESGKVLPREDKVKFDELAKDLENDYKVNGKRSLPDLSYRVGHLREFFGMDRAIDITTDRARAYQRKRLEEKASPATINREMAALRRMLSLAFNAGKLSRIPKLEMLAEDNVRQGFVDHGAFSVLLSNLNGVISELVEFTYLSGWRKGEVMKLQITDVDEWARVVRLDGKNSKNKEPRILPLTGRLWEIIEARLKDRRPGCPWLFHRNGKPIKDFRDAWEAACKASNLEGLLVHDLRRSAARNLSRAGVPESVAMGITGHKTRSMYRRYRIVDERDLKEATENLQAYLKTQPQTAVVVPLKKVAGE
jgi:integrase